MEHVPGDLSQRVHNDIMNRQELSPKSVLVPLGHTNQGDESNTELAQMMKAFQLLQTAKR